MDQMDWLTLKKRKGEQFLEGVCEGTLRSALEEFFPLLRYFETGQASGFKRVEVAHVCDSDSDAICVGEAEGFLGRPHH